MKQTKNLTQLKNWLFTQPVKFALTFFGISIVLMLIWSLFEMAIDSESILPMVLIVLVSFVFSTYYMIKKLPHTDMSQHDFVAITNGVSLISIVSSLLAILTIDFMGPNIRQQMFLMFMLHETMFTMVVLLISIITLYILGLAVAGVYAKYKRATTIGISPWKVILSMPFSFLLMWTPGYLINDKKQTNNLSIKSNWYKRFNDWALENSANLLSVFLFLLLFKCVIAGLSTLVLTIVLLLLYALWYKKHTKDFMKKLNNGYALTSVVINLTMLVMILLTSFLY